jgi:hypothetical protein
MTRPFHDSRHACYQVPKTIFQPACQHQRDALCWLPRCQPTSVYFDECQMPVSTVGPEPAHFETQKCMIPTYAAPQRMDDHLRGTCQWPAPFQRRIRIRFPPLFIRIRTRIHGVVITAQAGSNPRNAPLPVRVRRIRDSGSRPIHTPQMKGHIRSYLPS